MKRDDRCTLGQLGVTPGRVPDYVKGRCGYVVDHENGRATAWCGDVALYKTTRRGSHRPGKLCAKHAAIARARRDADLIEMRSL